MTGSQGAFQSAIREPAESQFAATAWEDFYQVHRLVCAAFADRAAAIAARILFRFDREGEHGWLYVQTKTPPDWSRLPEKLGLQVIGPVLLQIPHGDRLRFRLLAKPSFRVGRRVAPWNGKLATLDGALAQREKFDRMGDLRGKRLTLRSEEDQRSWLAEKGERHGFSVEHVDLTDRSWFDSRKRRGRDGNVQEPERLPGGQLKPLFGTQFDGVLVVSDREKLVEAVRSGIGPQKAFGFGLLSLAPVGD